MTQVPWRVVLDHFQAILSHFQDYYFVDLDHENRISTGWDNDKLFILVKGGGEPIFKKQNRITVITPCCRPQNLNTIKNSVDFNHVEEWIIVYDGNRVSEIPDIFNDHPHKDKIKQWVFKGPGIFSILLVVAIITLPLNSIIPSRTISIE